MKERYNILDWIRAIALLNMIAYHLMWDLVYMYNVKIPFMYPTSTAGVFYQQAICWTFILLSGFCWGLSRNHLKRGLIVTGGSIIITAVTLIVMPQNRVIFGVLSLIGASMLLMIPLNMLYQLILKRCKLVPRVLFNTFGILISFGLFLMFKNVNYGTLSFFGKEIVVSSSLYKNYFTSFIGFMHPGFFSTDYFSILPWFFLFQTGYFLFNIFKDLNLFRFLKGPKIMPLEFIGRNSLIIYMIHQPVVYGILEVVFSLF